MDADQRVDLRETSAAADAFGTLADETRVAILRALWDAGEAMAFSELRSAVGAGDSGRFNYHLGKLTDRFVRKTAAGYELTYAGRQAIGSVRSGVYTDEAALDPVEAGDCHRCGGTLLATYEDETVEVACRDCGETVTQFGAPPTLVESFDREDLPLAFSHWVMTLFERAQRGFCPQCSGRVEPSLDPTLREEAGILGVEYTCTVCGQTVSGSVGAVTLDDPAVVAFHDDHGIDLRDRPVWTVAWPFRPHATVEREDPLRVRVVAEADGDRLALTLDERFDVVAAEHLSRE
jgi:DNA-directed RNA polymerase subunit RPC12/RpoP